MNSILNIIWNVSWIFIFIVYLIFSCIILQKFSVSDNSNDSAKILWEWGKLIIVTIFIFVGLFILLVLLKLYGPWNQWP